MTLGHVDLVTEREHIPAHRLSLFVMSWYQISITGLHIDQQSCFPLNRGKLVNEATSKRSRTNPVLCSRAGCKTQETLKELSPLWHSFCHLFQQLSNSYLPFPSQLRCTMWKKKKRLVLFLQYVSSVLQTAEVNCSGSGLALPGPCRHLHAPESCLSRSYCPASQRRWWQSRIKSRIKIPDPS